MVDHVFNIGFCTQDALLFREYFALILLYPVFYCGCGLNLSLNIFSKPTDDEIYWPHYPIHSENCEEDGFGILSSQCGDVGMVWRLIIACIRCYRHQQLKLYISNCVFQATLDLNPSTISDDSIEDEGPAWLLVQWWTGGRSLLTDSCLQLVKKNLFFVFINNTFFVWYP